MAEAELAWDRLTPDVVRGTVDFNPRHVVDNKGHLGECRSCLCGKPLVDGVLVHPIANFACPCTHAGMESTAPEYLGFLPIEDAIGKVLAQVKFPAIPAEALDFRLELFGLILRPY